MKHKFINNEHIVHAGMITFGAASMFNIKEYLNNNGHDIYFSWALSIALSIILISMSIMLAKSDNFAGRAFKLKLASVITLCLLSGTLQMLAYKMHGLNTIIAAIFGYGFPIVAEALLALASAEHDKEMIEKKYTQMQESVKHSITNAISESFEQIDVVNNKEYIESQIRKIVKSQTDAIVAQLMPNNSQIVNPNSQIYDSNLRIENVNSQITNETCDNNQTDSQTCDTEITKITNIDANENSQESQITPVTEEPGDFFDGFTNEQDSQITSQDSQIVKPNSQEIRKLSKKELKLQKLLSHLTRKFANTEFDKITNIELAQHVGVSEGSIRNYMNELKSQKYITVENGILKIQNGQIA